MPGEPILVGDLVDVPLVGVAPEWPIDKALTLAAEHGRSVLPVLENHEFFGVVSFEPQLVLRLLQANRQLTVAEALEKEVPWLEARLEAQTVSWEKSAFWAVRENGGFRGLVRRERALMALHYNSAYFPWKEIADELPVGVVVVDASERVCLFNRMAKRILALEEKAVVGARLKEVLPDSRLCEVLETGRARFGYKYKIGEKVIVANHMPMQINGWRGAVSVFQDVSEIEQLSGQLECYRLLAKHLDAILDCSYDGIYITDAKANTIRVNKAYERITGLKAADLVGRNMRDLVAEGVLSGSLTLEVVKNAKVINMVQHTCTGKEILVTGNPIFDEEGQVCLVVSNVRDMSELNRLRAELEKSQELAKVYQTELIQLRREWANKVNIIARSKVMQEVINLAQRVALTDSTVLLLGESGVGKDKIAELIHYTSGRAEAGSLVKINCAAFPRDLLEAELFGYEEGAFTGARKGGKPGLFEVANHGTLFLDEIGEMPLELQAKLLRIIEERVFRRVGGLKQVEVDVRLICASNRDLAGMVKEGRFRLDLYYRINVVPLWIPPLRERVDDIMPLLLYYLERFNKKYGYHKVLTPEALDRLLCYHWPGNVRELVNLVERVVVTSGGERITVEDLPFQLKEGGAVTRTYGSLRHMVEETAAKLVLEAYKTYGSTRKAAKALGVSQTTVVRKLKQVKKEQFDA